jgi:hypothetical protein
MKENLISLKKNLLQARPNEQAQIAIEFARKLECERVFEYIRELFEDDSFSLAYKLILSPPHILPLLTFSGFSVEVIHWLYSNDPELKADNEDIHDHFSTIVSVALKGDPYTCFDFCKSGDGNFSVDRNFLFKEGTIHVIKPETIHQVVMRPGQSAVSLRILLPSTRTVSHVYDKEGNIIREIKDSMLERQKEVSKILGAVS